MESIDKSFVDILQFNQVSYDQLLAFYKSQVLLEDELLFIALGVQFYKSDLDQFIQQASRSVTNKMMLFFTKYLQKSSTSKIEAHLITVTNVENDLVQFTELPGLTKVADFKFNVIFAKYNFSWFAGIYEGGTLQIICIPSKMRKTVKTIMINFLKTLKLDAKNVVEMEMELTSQDPNAFDSLALIQLVTTFFKKDASAVYFQQLDEQQIVEFYEKQTTIDWLLLDIYSRFQKLRKQSSQSKKLQANQSDLPSFQHINQQSMRNSNDFDKTLMKSMQKHQDFLPKDSMTRYLNRLREEEETEKQERMKKIRKAAIGNENVELSKEQFIYMMEKYKSDVINDLKRQELEMKPDTFLQKFLFQQGGVIEPITTPDGQEDFNIRLTPAQMKQLLQKYESHFNGKIQQEREMEQRKHEEEQLNNFLKFQQLLEQNYHSNPVLYQELLDEYNQRLHLQLLDKMGLPQKKKSLNSSKLLQSSQASFVNKSAVQFLSVNNVTQPSKSKSGIIQSPSFSYQIKTEGEVIASRYEKKISKAEYLRLQNEYLASENMVNFIVRYLEEKQKVQPSATLKAFKQRIFYLTTTFFRHLTAKSLDPNLIQYDAASHYTQGYVGKGNTIFDQFDLIIVPIVINQQEYTLTLINLAAKEVTYFDTLMNGDGARIIANVPHIQQALFMNPNLCSILKFLEQEYNQKIMKNLNIFDWKFKYSNHEKPLDYRFSGLLLLLIMHNISLGNWKNIVANQKSIMEFHQKLISFLLEIGITQNKKKELEKRFDSLPL